MKRKAVFFSTLLFLTGCTSTAHFDLDSRVDCAIDEVLSLDMLHPNYSSKYYSYYLEPSVGRVYANGTGNVFNYNGTQFVMNLNIPSIINRAYYKDYVNEDFSLTDPIYEKNGEYKDYDGHDNSYELSIYQEDNSYVTMLTTADMVFLSVSEERDCPNLASEMLKVARTVQVNRTLVVDTFSNRQTISYTRKKVELFQYFAPENGAVEDLFSQSSDSYEQPGTVTDLDNYASDNFGEPTPTPEPPMEESVQEEINFVEDEGDPNATEPPAEATVTPEEAPVETETPTETPEATATPETQG